MTRVIASLAELGFVARSAHPADGHVVDAEYGCGAHSDTPAPAGSGSPLYDPYDDGVLDVVEPPTPSEEEPQASSEQPEPTDVSDPATE